MLMLFTKTDNDDAFSVDGPARVAYNDGVVDITVGNLVITMPEFDARSLDIMLGMAYGMSIGGSDEK